MKKTIIYSKAMENNVCKISLTFVLVLITSFMCILAFALIYKFKCYLGIDIFPDKHLSDFVVLVK
ncbi:hypothetical protein LNTAR_18680 [Lentisphaera araneosa HTCC2155]|uniref:Uncharacterized protein n=1 Tax=Lentisphaera araneosa HTCC2155 TaxID=313628 RepID=A6DNP2_9BACT|nr:hypothetical protein LNTAR_18680 [Lentisphaera araneosa HTCC2155]